MRTSTPLWTSSDVDRNGLQVLTLPECVELLGTTTLGRVAITDRALPVILPVNFVVVDDGIVFRTGIGTKLAAATARSVVAFEADDIDELGGTGWSVCVTGRSERVTDPATIERVQAAGLSPVVRSDPGVHVRINLDVVTGRRVH